MISGDLFKKRYGEWVYPVQSVKVGSADEPATPEPTTPVAGDYARAPDPIVYPEAPMEWEWAFALAQPYRTFLFTAIMPLEPEPEVKPAGRGGFEFL